MTASDAVTRGREAFEREQWSDACVLLSSAERLAPLDPEDLDRLATAAYLVGDDAASTDARARAHARFLERGDTIPAARSAFWLAFTQLEKPARQAQARGWLARARRLLDECGRECVEDGFLLCTLAIQKVMEGDLGAALLSFEQAAAIGARFHNPDVTALARHGEARVLLRMNRRADGFTLMDEVMIAVAGGEVTPMIAGRHLLQRDQRVLRRLRPPPRAGVDDGPDGMVRGAPRHGAVPRAMLRPALGADAAARRVDRGDSRSAARLRVADGRP